MAEDQQEMLKTYLEAKAKGGVSSDNYRQNNRHRNPRQQTQANEIPMPIRNFLEDLSNAIVEKRTETFEDMYQNEYTKLSEQLVKQRKRDNRFQQEQMCRWPSVNEAQQFLGDSFIVQVVYKELYYRHIFSRFNEKNLLAQDRFDAYCNYQIMFDQIAKDLSQGAQCDDEKSLIKALPVTYCWDLLDEYLFQMLLFSQFKARVVSRKAKMEQAKAESMGGETEEPLQPDPQLDADFSLIKENPHIFHTQEVSTMLKKLISLSGIDSYLADKKAGKTNLPPPTQALYIGYFSYVQLIRYHLLIGEYDIALRTADFLDIHIETDALYYRSPACHIYLMYYLAFSLFMSKRFSDCTSICNKMLWFLLKIQRFGPISSLYEQQSKVQEKLGRLLVLCVTFAPDNYHSHVEEQVQQMLQDRYADDISILKTWGYEDEAQLYTQKLMEFFNTVCCKYVCLIPTDWNQSFSPLDSHNQQWFVFWSCIESVKAIPRVRSILKMYTKISLEKLAKLLNLESEDAVRQTLAGVKRGLNQLVLGENGHFVPGRAERCSDLEFSIDETTKEVLVGRIESEKQVKETYLKEIKRLTEIGEKAKGAKRMSM